MAKLEGVKTLDMVGGKITRVEYVGAVYEKTDESASEGDIVQVIAESWGDIESGAFYRAIKTVEDDDGYRFTIIEFPTEASGFESDFAVFRKVYDSNLPTIEEVNAKVDALAERVDALEGEKQAEPVPTIKEGNRVKALTDGQFYDIEAGEIGTIERFSEYLKSKGDPYYIVVETEDNYDYFRPQDIELVTEDDEEETERPTVGDVVKVVRDESGHRAKIGDVVTIVEDEHDDHPYKCKFLDGTHAGWFYESEVEKISEDKTAETITFEGAEYTLVDRKAQPGDVVVFTKSSVTWVKNGKPYGPVSEELDFIDEDGDHLAIYRPEYGRTPENTKVYESVSTKHRTVKRKARVGERILITDARPSRAIGQNYVEGDVFTVTETGVCGPNDVYVKEQPRLIDGSEYEVIVEEVAKLKVGDYAKIIRSEYGREGEIVEIIEYNGSFRIKPGNIATKGVICGRISQAEPDQLVKATEEEVEEAKRAAKLEAIGRKPGEFKKGDIVRTKFYGLLEVDSVVEKDEHPIKVTIEGEPDAMMAEGCELIAPVESRVDVD